MEIEKLVKIDHIKEKMIEPELNFLLELKKYLQVPVYVYGSIFRKDYFSNKSDIDVAIFSDNTESTAKRMANFLEVNKSKIKIFKMKSTFQKTHKSKTYWGFKTKYMLDVSDYTKNQKDWTKLFYYRKKYKVFEIMIIDKKYKKQVLAIHREHFYHNFPFFYSLLIYFVKMLHYYFYLSKSIYYPIKRFLLNADKIQIQKIEIVGTL